MPEEFFPKKTFRHSVKAFRFGKTANSNFDFVILKEAFGRINYMKKTILGLILLSVFSISGIAQKSSLTPLTNRHLTVITQPEAMVWVDEISRGKTDSSGKLVIKHLPSGVRKLRVRAFGFKEHLQNLTAVQQGEIKITLVKTTDQAELLFQQAEAEKDREKAADLYEKALEKRPKFPEAQLGLARILVALDDTDGAFKAIAAARKLRPNYAEVSAVEGRIYKTLGEEANAVASFKRALKEGGNFQPEANAGLGLLYKEKAESAGNTGDYATEEANYKLAISFLTASIKQLSVSTDAEVMYQELGSIYEKLNNKKQAIALYEEFLRIFPNSQSASAIQSFIVQLKKP